MPNFEQFFDEYGRKARLAPALLCLPPYLLIGHFIIWSLVDPSIRSALAITTGDITYSVALLYLLIQIHRMVSKEFFQDRRRFPTTLALLPNGWLSNEYRVAIARKVKGDFGLDLPTEVDVQADRSNCLRRCEEVGSLIVGSVGRGRLLHQHNIEYGFWRNLLGGAVVATMVSGIAAISFRWLQPNPNALTVALILLVVYAIPSLLARPILRHFSQEYARMLFREYIAGGHAA